MRRAIASGFCRIFFGLLCLLYAMNAVSQQPGTFVIEHEFVAVTGCMAWQNSEQVLKKTGLCSFGFIAGGMKLTDIECHSKLSGADTILDCTYSPIAKLSKNPKTPALHEGETLFPELSLGPDGCLVEINNPGSAPKCSFNVNLQALTIPNVTCTSSVGGGNTTVSCEYPKVAQ